MRKTHSWTRSEECFLKVFFKKLDYNELSIQLNNINNNVKRTNVAILNRAYKLKLSRTKKEINFKEAKELVFEYIKKDCYTIPQISKKTKIPLLMVKRVFEFNYTPLKKPYEEVEGNYYRNEKDILNSLQISYNIKDLKGWELEQINK